MLMFSNRKGVGIIGAIMLFMVFVVMWFVWLGGWVAYVGHQVVIDNSLTGIEAFAFDNLNLIIMLVLILAMMGWAYFGGQQ